MRLRNSMVHIDCHKVCSDSSLLKEMFLSIWRFCAFLPSHIQGPIEVEKVDQEGWDKLETYRRLKAFRKGETS